MRKRYSRLFTATLSLAALLLSTLPASAGAPAASPPAAQASPDYGFPLFPWLPPGFGPGFPWLPPGNPGDPGTPPGNPGDPGTPPGNPGDPGTPPGNPGDPGTPPGNPGDPGTPPGGGGSAVPDGFPNGFQVPISRETGRPVGGWGCDPTGATDGGGVTHTPILFVHGATRTAHDWDQNRQYFIQHGYSPCELWAVSYGRQSEQQPETNETSAPTIQEFVHNMIAYLKQNKNANVTQVAIVAHSLGGTVTRTWLMSSNESGLVRALVTVASPHHGLGICYNESGATCRELYSGSQWLKRLNQTETYPGVRTMTIYDGTGQFDTFYQGSLKDSPALRGATNHAYNVEQRTRYDHVGLISATAALQYEWLNGERVSAKKR